MEVVMEVKEQERIREAVRGRYAGVAEGRSDGGKRDKTAPAACCGASNAQKSDAGAGCGCGQGGGAVGLSSLIGYSAGDLAKVPEGADMGLGCGNPVALASLKAGETVVDLGSGGGFDCFLAAGRVGARGRVIGVDMTAEMVSKARQNAVKADAANVSFRLGEIEHLPVADGRADIIISNCVINLSVDKAQVFREAFRVLKPGGRLAVSDIVATQPLPPEIRKDLEMVSVCVGGAATVEETRAMLESAGFEGIGIEANPGSRKAIEAYAPGRDAGDYVVSAYIQAVKPSRS
jgi:arsenite methyltransferase